MSRPYPIPTERRRYFYLPVLELTRAIIQRKTFQCSQLPQEAIPTHQGDVLHIIQWPAETSLQTQFQQNYPECQPQEYPLVTFSLLAKTFPELKHWQRAEGFRLTVED